MEGPVGSRPAVEPATRPDRGPDVGRGIGGQEPPDIFRAPELQHPFDYVAGMALQIEGGWIDIPEQGRGQLGHGLLLSPV